MDPIGDADAIRLVLHQHVNVLIDEYDNFANEVLVSRQKGEGRYQELVGGEGVIKTLFKAIKDAAEGRGLDRVFITGVLPVVLADITSGYNVVKDISQESRYADLCGFHEDEIRAVLQRVVVNCDLPSEQTGEALDLMRTFYNGYNFTLQPEGGQIYNPTLARTSIPVKLVAVLDKGSRTLSPGSRCVRGATPHHRKLDAGFAPLPQWLDGVLDALAYALHRLRDLRSLRQFRQYARLSGGSGQKAEPCAL